MEDLFDYIHVGGFFTAGLAASAIALLSRGKLRDVAIGNAIPLFVSSLTYLVLRSIPDQPELRWLGYTVACAFFAFETATALRQTKTNAIAAGGFTAVTLFTGFVIYFLQKWLDASLMLGLGFVTFAIALLFILLGRKGNEEKVATRMSEPRKWFLQPAIDVFWYEGIYFVYFTMAWTAYAIIYSLGPAFGEIMSRSMEELAYFILEFFAKYIVAAVNIYIVYAGQSDMIPDVLRQRFRNFTTRDTRV